MPIMMARSRNREFSLMPMETGPRWVKTASLWLAPGLKRAPRGARR